MRPLAEAKGQELKVVIGSAAVALADRLRVAQSLLNLVSNAVKFAPQGGHIIITVASQNGDCSISVADDGPGIAPEATGDRVRRVLQTLVGPAGAGNWPWPLADASPGSGDGRPDHTRERGRPGIRFPDRAARGMITDLQGTPIHDSDQAILVADDEGCYVDVNQAALDLLGYPRDELIGRTIWEITPAEYREEGKAQFAQMAKTGEDAGALAGGALGRYAA